MTADADEATVRVDLSVPEMDCPSCAGKVERALADVDGIEELDLRPTSATAVVAYDAERVSEERIAGAVEAAGYEVVGTDGDGLDVGDPAAVWRSHRAIGVWIGAALLLVGLAIEFLAAVPNPGVVDLAAVSTALYELRLADLAFLGAVLASGLPVVREGLYSVRTRSLDIDLLMGAAIVAASGIGYVVEAATLAVLYSMAELLERYTMDRTRSSLRELVELSPDTATVLRDGTEETVPADAVAVGDVVVVRPGDRIPTDGVVVDGESAVDESAITGESVPVDRSAGDEVFAGAIAENGYLEVEATARAEESTIARIVELVTEAQAGQTEQEQFVDRFADYYTPIVVAAALLTAFVPPLLLGWAFDTWFVRGLTLLVIACPCAFVISTPISVASGVTAAAKNGVLIKGGEHLEALGDVDAVAMDKTGTLTRGELAVTDVVALDGVDRDELLATVAALEARSEHPVADAIRSYAAEQGLGPDAPAGESADVSTADADGAPAVDSDGVSAADSDCVSVDRSDGAPAADSDGVPVDSSDGAPAVDPSDVEGFEAIPGKGVRGEIDGTDYYVGKPALLADRGVDLSHRHARTDGGAAEPSIADCEREDCVDVREDVVAALQAEGKTVVLVGTGDRLLGAIAIADELRPTAARTVQRLHELGVERVVVLTGDNEGTARAVAADVGVDEYRAGLLPEEKVDAVEALCDEHGSVAMVGDGINDAPSLAAASVGIAMGAAGTDTAIETADVALMGDDLTGLPYCYELAGRTTGVIRQNVWSSLGVKLLLAVGAPLGYVTIAVAVVVGDMGMSLAVTGNAMRLARLDPADVFGESAPAVGPASGAVPDDAAADVAASVGAGSAGDGSDAG